MNTQNFHKAEELAGQLISNECIDLVDDTESDSDQNNDNDSQFSVCQFCMQVFCTVDELNDHLKTHVESLVCGVCGCVCQNFEQLVLS